MTTFEVKCINQTWLNAFFNEWDMPHPSIKGHDNLKMNIQRLLLIYLLLH